MDPVKKTRLVLGYLYEKGYTQALDALQKESGEEFDPDLYVHGGELESILDASVTQAAGTQPKQVDLADLAEGPENVYAKELVGTIKNHHNGNILAVQLREDGLLVTASADRTMRVGRVVNLDSGHVAVEGTQILTHHSGGVLDLDFHPKIRSLLAAASMDRSGSLIDLTTNEPIQVFNHLKYVNRVGFSRDGQYIVFGSYDKTATIHRKLEGKNEYELAKRLSLAGAVESLAFSHDGKELVLGVRDDNYLHFIDLTTPELKESTLNLNELGDDWVSFSPLDITYSPNDKYLLICTDKDRIILYSRQDGKQICSFYGLAVGELAQPRALFHPSGRYIYATAQHGHIFVWDVLTQCIVATLKGHTDTVRNLWYDTKQDVLVSVGFDQTVRFWK
eukprot:comp14708_c0_seq1/m.11095 comp14708_c0_seq1/g.11095  ORF comp14708_c0_seq1/g.11095 comp14708_c0_seq1/m.11095 type:complete len:392 (-) comp14708_c0_seq1:370-1545(-)